MSRIARYASTSTYTHIIARGVNKQNIFLEESDYERYMKILSNLKSELSFDVIAYCLMTNHVHLLLHDPDKRFSAIMQRLSGTYAMYFNKKYGRNGHLFQNRFYSVPVISTPQLISSVIYIHNNPSSAHICSASSYPWSSYSEYLESPSICNTSPLLALYSSKDQFIQAHSHANPKDIFEFETQEYKKDILDDQIKTFICSQIGGSDPTKIQSLRPRDRNLILHYLKAHHVPINRIARLTGLTPSMIHHC